MGRADRVKQEEAELQDLLVNGEEGPAHRRSVDGRECAFCTSPATMLVDPSEVAAVAESDLPVCDECWAEESSNPFEEMDEDREQLEMIRKLVAEGSYYEDDDDQYDEEIGDL